MEKTLVILAAGLGSRFGGLKQMAPMGPNGEFIIDYSIYDAIKVGFTKVVFVIKKELFEDFESTIGNRIKGHIDIEYVFQDVKDIPVEVNFERIKPWGTGQAVLCARSKVEGNFAIINADDFYGYDAFKVASEKLENVNESEYGLVTYKAVNTLTENGAVKRGVCKIKDDYLEGLNESSLVKTDDYIACESLVTNEKYTASFDTLVSMNLILFNKNIFNYLEDDFVEFLNSDCENSEFLIPEVLQNHIKSGDIKVKVYSTDAKWYGVTYKEDTDSVKNAISDFIKTGEYPNNLWS